MTARFTGPVEDVRSVVQLESTEPVHGQNLAEEVLERLARAGRFRDEETAEHIERMSRSCGLIAQALGWDAGECNKLRAASAMHDIGKVGIPDAILRKPDALTPEERKIIETHTQIGHDILAGSEDEALVLAASVALTHHEAFDGTGYPRSLAGEQIPIEGRIAAVADVFDALTHDRAYRAALDVDEALRLLREGRGTKFDPQVLDAFQQALPEIEELRHLYPDSDSSGKQTLFEREPERKAAAPAPAAATMTAREREVAQLLACGLSGEDIAGRLFLSSETVRTHIRNAMQRMNASTRPHLIALALKSGEISLDNVRPTSD